MQHGPLHHFVRVANQRASCLRTPLDRELNPLRNGHLRQALQKSLASHGIRLGFGHRFGQHRFVDMRLAEKFMKQMFLLGSHRRCIDERHRQRRRCAHTVQIVHKGLHVRCREMAGRRSQVIAIAGFIIDQRVADGRLDGKISRGKVKQRLERLLPLQCFQKIFDGQRENSLFGALGDRLIGIDRQDG